LPPGLGASARLPKGSSWNITSIRITGDIFPSEKTVNHTTEGFAYIVAFILGVSIRLGIGFGAGYALGILIGWEPLYAGAIGMCMMLFIGGRE